MKEYSKHDIKKHIANTFGFDIIKITVLEYGTDPTKYCMFSVCDIVYQAYNDILNIYGYVDQYSYDD